MVVQEPGPGGGDLAQGRVLALEAGRGCGLARLKRLVDIEEVMDLLAEMGRHIVEVPHAGPPGIAQRNTDDLGVGPLLVFHPENPNWPGGDPAAREDRVFQQHKGIEGVTVLGERVRDEPVVGRVDGRREQPPVQVQYVAVMVERGTSMTTSTALALRSSASAATGPVGTGSLTPASWAILSEGIRGHSPASSRENTSSLVPTPSTRSS